MLNEEALRVLETLDGWVAQLLTSSPWFTWRTFLHLKNIPHICHLYHLPDMWRKICHVEKFQISMRDKCGEIWNFSTCGVISNFAIWKMWRNLKFLHIWHVCDVENASTCVKFMSFIVKLVLSQFMHFCRKSVLLRFTRFCVEKSWTKNCACGEKKTNIRYAYDNQCWRL